MSGKAAQIAAAEEAAAQELGEGADHPGAVFVTAFGDIGATWFVEGKTFEQAQTLYREMTASQLQTLVANAERLKAEQPKLLAEIRALRGAPSPVSANLAPDAVGGGRAPAGKDIKSLEARIGSNLARVAGSIELPAGN